MKTLLAIVAHPDDESLFMGGTIAKYARKKDWNVVVVVAADGMCGRELDRKQQFLKACQELGIERAETRTWFDDQQADAQTRLQMNRMVSEVIAEYKPQLVITHYHSDLNVDHRRVCEAVLVETRGVCDVLMCEPEWLGRCIGTPFKPNHVESLTLASRKQKRAACQCYREELRHFPHPRNLRRLTERTTEPFVRIGQWA